MVDFFSYTHIVPVTDQFGNGQLGQRAGVVGQRTSSNDEAEPEGWQMIDSPRLELVLARDTDARSRSRWLSSAFSRSPQPVGQSRIR